MAKQKAVKPKAVKLSSQKSEKTRSSLENLFRLVWPKIVIARQINNDVSDKEIEDEAIRASNQVIERILKGRKKNVTVDMKVKVTAATWGTLSEAGLILGCTPEKALDLFLNQSSWFCDWGNNGFKL